MKFKDGSSAAVFTKNHREYLEDAVERNTVDRVRPTTFRSALRWASARDANDALGSLKVYFAAVGGENTIEYQADLIQVLLDPENGDPATEEALACELESTKGEGLWEEDGKPVKTLYVISRCERLSESFRASDLIKISDDNPISENYGYSYCVAYPHQPMKSIDFEVHPEEVLSPEKYVEGATRKVSVDVNERSPAARKACVDHFGYRCAVCDFDFEDFYGELGKGFIHVHHLKPLSDVDGRYEVDPVSDMRPVCPNCHAMIHRATPTLSVEELKGRVRPPV